MIGLRLKSDPINNRRMRFLASLLLLFLVSPATLLAEVDGQLKSKQSIVLDPIENETIAQLTRALYETEYSPEIKYKPGTLEVPRELKGVWSGMKLERQVFLDVELELDDLVPDSPPVKIRIGFEPSKVLVKHSNPGKGKLLGGISMELDKKKRRDFFLSGHYNSGMALFFPPLSSGLEAVILCPRGWGEPPTVDKSNPGWADQQPRAADYQVLQESGYELKNVTFNVISAFISAELTFGYEGDGEVLLLNTDTLNSSDPFLDRARGKKVRLEVAYNSSVDQPKISYPQRSSVPSPATIAGLRFLINFQGPAGHLREIELDDLISVQTIQSLDGVLVKAGDSSWPVKPGVCYLVSSQQRAKDKYAMKTKE